MDKLWTIDGKQKIYFENRLFFYCIFFCSKNLIFLFLSKRTLFERKKISFSTWEMVVRDRTLKVKEWGRKREREREKHRKRREKIKTRERCSSRYSIVCEKINESIQCVVWGESTDSRKRRKKKKSRSEKEEWKRMEERKSGGIRFVSISSPSNKLMPLWFRLEWIGEQFLENSTSSVCNLTGKLFSHSRTRMRGKK